MSYLQGVKDDVQSLKDAVERLAENRDGNQNVNTLKVEGMGSAWTGLALGIALGFVFAGCAWMVSLSNKAEMVAQQANAYRAAVYMLAPRFAQEIDKELDNQRKRENGNPDPDHH